MPDLSPEALEQIRAIVDGALARALETIGRRFEAVDARFDAVDRRFDGVEGRLAGVDGRLDGLDHRLDGVDHRLAGLEVRLEDGLAENRRYFGVIAESLQTKLELVIEGQIGLDQKLDRRCDSLARDVEGLDRRMLRMSARLPARRRRR